MAIQGQADGALDQRGDGRSNEKWSAMGCILKKSAGPSDRKNGVEKNESRMTLSLTDQCEEDMVNPGFCFRNTVKGEVSVRAPGQMSGKGLETHVCSRR